MAQVLFITISVLWGSGFILMKRAGLAFGPLSIATGRLLAGSALLLLLALVQRRPWGLGKKHVPGMALVAVICYVWPFAVQPYFITRSNGSALMGMIIALVPLLTIIVSIPMLGIRPTRRELIGVLMGLGFFGLLMRDAGAVLHIAPLDLAMAASVPLCYAITNTFIKRHFSSVPAMTFTGAALGLGGLLLLPLSLAFERVPLAGRGVSNAGAAWSGDGGLGWSAVSLIMLGLLCTGAAYYMFYHLVQTRGPLFAGMVSYALPVVAMLWGRAYGERLTATQVAAVTGILASVVLVQLRTPAALRPPPVVLPPD